MKLIVCADKRNGLAFHHRRQSRDRMVCEDILRLSKGRLWLSPYSAKLFPPLAGLCVQEAPTPPQGAYCFLEAVNITPYLERAEQLIVYRWNRDYPADLTLCMEGWRLVRREDFAGYSHECLSREEYER